MTSAACAPRVESGTGVTIVAKGLKPDQADEIRALILKRTRQGGPATERVPEARAPQPAPARAPSSDTAAPPASASPTSNKNPRAVGRTRLDADALIAKLTDLHRAGVLTDAELEDKKARVGQLVRGETLSSTPA